MLYHNEVMRKFKEFMEHRDIREIERHLKTSTANPMGQKIIEMVRDIIQQHGYTEQMAILNGNRAKARTYIEACKDLENLFESLIKKERKP